MPSVCQRHEIYGRVHLLYRNGSEIGIFAQSRGRDATADDGELQQIADKVGELITALRR